MRRSIITALAALCLTAAALAQNAKIDGIRKEYAAIKADVADLQRAGAKGKWYVLTLDDNAYGRRYVGSDHFRARLHFYYELESETVIPILRYATEEVEADEQRIRREDSPFISTRRTATKITSNAHSSWTKANRYSTPKTTKS